MNLAWGSGHVRFDCNGRGDESLQCFDFWFHLQTHERICPFANVVCQFCNLELIQDQVMPSLLSNVVAALCVVAGLLRI